MESLRSGQRTQVLTQLCIPTSVNRSYSRWATSCEIPIAVMFVERLLRCTERTDFATSSSLCAADIFATALPTPLYPPQNPKSYHSALGEKPISRPIIWTRVKAWSFPSNAVQKLTSFTSQEDHSMNLPIDHIQES